MSVAPALKQKGFRGKKLWEFVRPYFGRLVAATLLACISAPVGLVLPMLTGKVIDAALLTGGLEQLRQVVLWFIVLCGVLAVLSFTSNYLLNSVGAHLLRDLRLNLFSHAVRLSQDFHDSRRTGELLSRIASDLGQIQGFLTGTIPLGIPGVISFICILAMLCFIHFKLALVSLLIIPPSALVSIVIGRIIRHLATEQQDALADSTAFAEETINGIRTVQSASREGLEGKRYFDKLGTLLGIQLKNIRRTSTSSALVTAIQLISTVLVLWYGGILIFRKELTPGDLVAFMLLAQTLGTIVGGIGGLYTSYQSMAGASVRIFEILETQSSIKDHPDAMPVSNLKGAVRFNNVIFRYPLQRDRLAIKGVDLEIKPGEMVCLVGPSGAGKSTLFSLLLRFYDPTEGTICIDGTDLRSIKLNDMRKAIGLVPQDIFIFRGTIADNISYFKPQASREEVQAAAAAAGADEFIERLPKRYDEFVGERGVKLSAGQRQRIAIARAFLVNPAILLLDEPTSSLDADSEEKVRRALAKLLNGRTTIVIAHRLATARLADRILVIDQGTVVASGTHDTLYDSNELYRRYWTLQSLNGKDSLLVDARAARAPGKETPSDIQSLAAPGLLLP